MLSFLAPLFLAGLAAIAIPVIVHLVNRERRTVVPFPSLMFLERVPYKSVRRRRIRHWALLLLRALALAALAAAFARPLLRRSGATVAGALGAREVVILLDRSYSMSRDGRWARAQQAARRAVAGLGPADRASVVVFDESAEAATLPTADRASLDAAISGARAGWGRTRYAPPFRLAQKLLAESDRPRREVVLITDFQRRGWEAREEARLPIGTTLTWTDVARDDDAPNAAVSQVTLRRDRGAGRDQLVAQARVTSTARCGDAACGPPRTVPVTLVLAGRAVETRSVTLSANGAATVDFAAVSVPVGRTRGSIQLAADDLTRDDTSHFVVSPTRDLSVLLLEPAAPRANQSLYLRRALELASQPPIRVDVRFADRAAVTDLDGRALVVVNDAVIRDVSFARRLSSWVQAGGGLIVVHGPRTDALSPAMREVAAVIPGAVTDRGSDGGRLATIDLSHPALEPFAAPRGGDFASARVLRYRTSQAVPGGTVLARWDDGGIALAERRVGRGISLAFTSTFDTYWNDLALQPVFLPLVHRLARHVARFDETRASVRVGELIDRARVSTTSGALVAESPSGVRLPLGDSATGARAAVALNEAGFWVVRPAGSSPGSGEIIAVNVDPAEGDPARVEPETIAAAVASTPGARDAAGSRIDLTPDEMEGRQMLWWYFLAAAALALAAEVLVANRLSRRAR